MKFNFYLFFFISLFFFILSSFHCFVLRSFRFFLLFSIIGIFHFLSSVVILIKESTAVFHTAKHEISWNLKIFNLGFFYKQINQPTPTCECVNELTCCINPKNIKRIAKKIQKIFSKKFLRKILENFFYS